MVSRKNIAVLAGGFAFGLLSITVHADSGPYDGHRYAELLNCHSALEHKEATKSLLPTSNHPLMVPGEKAGRAGIYVFHRAKAPEFFLAPDFPTNQQIGQLRANYLLDMKAHQKALENAGNKLIRVPDAPASSTQYSFAVEVDGENLKMDAVIHLDRDLIEIKPGQELFGMRRAPVRRGRLDAPMAGNAILESVGDSLGVEAQQAIAEDARRRIRLLESELDRRIEARNQPGVKPVARADQREQVQFLGRLREAVRICSKAVALDGITESLDGKLDRLSDGFQYRDQRIKQPTPGNAEGR